jgi:hypothetical protein
MWTAVKMWMICGRGVDSVVLPVGIVAGAVACWALSSVAMAQEVSPPAKDPRRGAPAIQNVYLVQSGCHSVLSEDR